MRTARNPAVTWCLKRLQEQSTWRGLILLATSAGIHISPDRAVDIISTGLLFVGIINVLRSEQPKRKKRKKREIVI